MVYSFEFYSSRLIYYESSLKTKEKVMSKLEEFSRAHCKSLGIGKIFEVILPTKNENCNVKLLEEYNISKRDGEIILEIK